MGAQQILSGEHLKWDLKKFCTGFKPSEIQIYTIRNGENGETLLSHWEGKTKSEKIDTLSGVIDVNLYDDMDIVLPDSRVYEII